MEVGRPVFREFFRAVADRRNVVYEGVEPDIGYVVRVEGKLNAPFETLFRARNAKVVERLFEELLDLLCAEAREDEVFVFVEKIYEPVLILADFEEVVALGDFHDFPENFGPFAVNPVLFLQELLLTRRVKALVFRLVDVALVEEHLENLADNLDVARLRRADIVVVRDFEKPAHCGEFFRLFVAKFHGGDARLARALLNLLTVLVKPREEVDGHSRKPFAAHDDVCEDFFVSVSEVGRAVGVIYCGCQIKILHSSEYEPMRRN